MVSQYLMTRTKKSSCRKDSTTHRYVLTFMYAHVEDKRLLLADSSISSTAMTAQSARPTVMVRNSMEQEGQFRKIYAGFVNGIAIPTEQVQHARLNDKTETIGIANRMKSTNEKEWIEVKNKSKKVRFMKRDQFGKTKEFGRIDRIW